MLLCIRFCVLIVLSMAAVQAEQPVNIILIMADDLGYETIAANGGESYSTPFIDQLADEGVRFEHCYAQPVCTPSRVKIMTGQSNARNYKSFRLLPRDQTTFAHYFQQAGYATCVAGKWQLGEEPDAPQHFGFDEALLWQHIGDGRHKIGDVRHDKRFENPHLERNGVREVYANGEFAPDLMTDFICDFIATNKDKPFLVYYPMILTHCPFVPTPKSADYNPLSLGSPTYKGDAKYFGGMVRYMDHLVQRIHQQVTAQGLADRTVIIFTGDNGTDKPVKSVLNGRQIAGAKGKTTDAGTRVPLIVHGADVVKGRVVSDIVDFSDMLPSLCELAGIDISAAVAPIDGRSFVPQLRGEVGQPRDWIYCWYSRSGKFQRDLKVFARNQQYKLYQSGEFYDISADVDEKNALKSLTPKQQQVRAMLQTVIDDHAQLRPVAGSAP